jgi:CheY-like chemotaxis protein
MSGQTILVADDETHILNVLTIKLRNAGFNVIAAEDGETALALVCEHMPDLVVTDYQMPGLSGVELLSKLRCKEETRHIPALLLTARGFSVSERDRLAGNIQEVIAKPFSPREVLACANEVLSEESVEPAGMAR